MENIPQPADAAYENGDRVRVYLAAEDPDSKFHGLVCEVVGDNPDNLDELTGREFDKHHYRLRRVDSGEVLPIQFRHEDLVPESEWPARE